MSVAIIDYGAGNLRSATKAFETALAREQRSDVVTVTNDPEIVARADRVVLPGDGAFRDCRLNLDQTPGMIEAVNAVIDDGRPFLGICVGMQLLATRGLEYGHTDGLDRIHGEVRMIEPSDGNHKIPHMGWNTLHQKKRHKLLHGIPLGEEGWHAYFLHAYQLVPEDEHDVLAVAHYGTEVTAIVAKGNVVGTQFHPEKSQKLGLALIANFLRWTP
ncbi:MAG: imidazole glycerol phosphate synthase subunit HisH [Bauldia sp.]|nr:imidazole glycerol phosphate synthase subunit HisH [Bauldia sp.]